MTYGGQPTFTDEKVLNYELGAKTMLADRRVTLNASVFYSDIDDLQVIADAGSCSSRIVLNAKAEAVGAEVELFARPDEHWDLGLSATYVQAEITESRLNASGAPIAGIRDGNRLPTSPEFQAAASATYNWPFSTSLDGFVNLTLPACGLVLHAVGRSGAVGGLRGLCRSAGILRVRRADHLAVHFRAGAAQLRFGQSALRREVGGVGGGRVREQFMG